VAKRQAVRGDRSAAGASKLPLWAQVRDDTATDLVARALPDGTRLESETELCQRYGVSRVTVRQALRDLRTKGLVHSRAGDGWFVGRSAEVEQKNLSLQGTPGVKVSFSEMARSKGLTPSAVVLSCDVVPADYEEASSLSVAPGSLLVVLRRLRLLDGLPIAVDQNVVPHALLPDPGSVDFSRESLFAQLRVNGANPHHADCEVQATAATEDDARLLDIEIGLPLLSVQEVLYDDTGRRIEIGHIKYRGDRYRFRTVVQSV
jgi:GntR family transcriptional regulator